MTGQSVTVTQGDVDSEFYWRAMEAGVVAWDIETSGLDFTRDVIGTCQIATHDAVNVVVLGERRPGKHLLDLIEAGDVRKVFHHAPFDLRFMAHRWKIGPQNVACTKIASKIVNPDLESPQHSLKPTLARWLGVNISKQLQVSDWLAEELSPEQLEYAAADVRYLLALERVLSEACEEAGVADLLSASWAYLPSRIALDLRGAGDVFAY